MIMANLKVTDLYQVASKVEADDVESFKGYYNDLVKQAAVDAGINVEKYDVLPLQVVLGENGNFCMMMLRNPFIPSYLYRNFTQEVSNELKRRNLKMGSVLIQTKQVRIDADNLPKKMKVKEDIIREIFKRGEDDDLFTGSEKNRGYVPVRKADRKRIEKEHDDMLARQFDIAHGIKVTEPVKVTEPEVTEETSEEDSDDIIESVKLSSIQVTMEGPEEVAVGEELESEEAIQYSCENNGQLVFVF